MPALRWRWDGVAVTKIRASLIRHHRAAILEAVEDIEAHVSHLGEPLDTVAAKTAVDIRAAIGALTDALMIAEDERVSRLGRLP